MIGQLNHVAIVVPDLDAAAAKYRDLLGARVHHAHDLPEHGVTVVFVDLDSVNPLVFLASLDTSVSFKPIWTQARYLKDVGPLRILRIAGQGKLPERELAKLQRIEMAGLPEGFELLVPRTN